MTQEDVNVDEAQVGRILHWVLEGDNQPSCSPAVVLEDSDITGKVKLRNLDNDRVLFLKPNHLKRELGSWHWPRECRSIIRNEPYAVR